MQSKTQSPPPAKARGLMVYPARWWRKQFMKFPLYYWRMGLGFILQRWFLVLTTRGRKSGLPRHTMLEFSVVKGRKYIGSGWGDRPQWYQNILADARVTLQSRDGIERAVARRANDDEELRQIYRIAKGKSPVWKDFLASLGIEDTEADFLAKKDRLRLLRLDPCDEETPAPMKIDLWWIWLVLAALVFFLIWR